MVDIKKMRYRHKKWYIWKRLTDFFYRELNVDILCIIQFTFEYNIKMSNIQTRPKKS